MTYHPIICQMSNCELFTKPFHIHCYRLVIRSVVNFQMRRCSPNLSTFIAIELSKHRFNTFAKVVASNWLKTDFLVKRSVYRNFQRARNPYALRKKNGLCSRASVSKCISLSLQLQLHLWHLIK